MSPIEMSPSTPTTPPTKIPKSVLRIRDKMESLGKPVTAATLREVLDKKEFNNIANVFRQSMSTSAREEYKKVARDDERRAWIAQYIIDPGFASVEGFNVTTAFNKQTAKEEEQWLTQEQLASPVYLNSITHAEAIIKELESRPHEYKVLADQGVLQYKFTMTSTQKEHGVVEENGTRATAELKENEYAEVTKDITSNYSRPAKRKAPPKEAESEEVKRMRCARQLRATTVRKCKALIDKSALDVSVCETNLAKLQAKGYPGAMTEWYEQKVVQFKESMVQAQAAYSKEATKVDIQPELADIEASTRDIDSALQQLDQQYKAFKDSVFCDVKKLVA